jgi:hypothetical protein
MSVPGINQEWQNYIQHGKMDNIKPINPIVLNPNPIKQEVPPPSALYISTKSKKIQLKSPIDLNWKWACDLPMINYWDSKIGIIKNQFVVSSTHPEELEANLLKLSEIKMEYREICLTSLVNEKNKYCDQRKIIIGLCYTDLLKYNPKEKPFKNAIILNVRIPNPDSTGWKDLPVKISNTGEIRLMGVKSQAVYDVLWNYLSTLLPKENPIISSETILINSNFYGGYAFYLEVFYQRLTQVYHASECRYEPSNKDPGIRLKIYFTEKGGFSFQMSGDGGQSICSLSIFSTGSILISGKCEEDRLFLLYNFLIDLLKIEYPFIHNPFSTSRRPTPSQEKYKFKTRKLKV